MKTYRKELWFEVPTRRAFINITPKVEECLKESGITEGLLLFNAMHITASVFINDDESGLHHDFEIWLEKLAPQQPVSQYKHNVGEDNADAHLKRQSWGEKWWWRSQRGSSISAPGSRFFTANLTADEERGFWSRSSENEGGQLKQSRNQINPI